MPHSKQEKQRVTTGVPGFDTVLNGGFLKGGAYIVMGHPGSGKTILGNQIAFHHCINGGKTVFVTLLAESHARMLLHLQDMTFFNEDVIGDCLVYLSFYSTMEEEGLGGLLKVLLKTIQEEKASLLVIDGLVSASVAARTPTDFKKFIHGLQVGVEALDCTAVLLTSPSQAGLPNTEHTMVDGVIELSDQLVSLRPLRELAVIKFRGSASFRGRHTMDISEDGITVYPRIETQYAVSATTSPDTHKARTAFGVPSLDKLLHGGLAGGTTTVVLGAAGTGKTLLGVHFLAAGAAKGEMSFGFSFSEPPERLRQKAEGISLAIEPYLEQGKLLLRCQSPLVGSIDSMGNEILETVRRLGVKRIFLDGIDGFQRANLQPPRLQRFVTALTNELVARGCSTMWSHELGHIGSSVLQLPREQLPATIDNLLAIQHVQVDSQLIRILSVLKEFDKTPDRSLREFHISDAGFEVSLSERSTEAIRRTAHQGENDG
jgi:circadian clock protein KaiC